MSPVVRAPSGPSFPSPPSSPSSPSSPLSGSSDRTRFGITYPYSGSSIRRFPPPNARRNAEPSGARRPIPILPQRLARELFPSPPIIIYIGNDKLVFNSLEDCVATLLKLPPSDKRRYLLSVPSTLCDEVNTLIERQNAQ